jgi:hypothetical protein
MYLIWSNEHRAWWRPQRQGYTSSIHEAGQYSRENALKICSNANYNHFFDARCDSAPNEIMVWRDDALESLGLKPLSFPARPA